MPKPKEVKKFEIITEIKNHPDIYNKMTITQIKAHIKKEFSTELTKACLYRWAKIYNFDYKDQRTKQGLKQGKAIKRTNQRIRILGIVIRNMCKELDIRHPNMLDKLLDGITADYGEYQGKAEIKAIEAQVYNEI